MAATNTTTSTTTTSTTSTTTTTSTLPTLPGPTVVDPPTPAILVMDAFTQEVGDVTLETVVSCGPDGLSAEHRIDGEPVEPETTGVATTALGKIYHRVVAAVDGDDVDYLFDGGWWADDLADGSCEPYELDTITVEPNTWDDYLDGGSIEVTEVLWGQLDLRDVACPYLLPDIRQDAIDRGLDVDLDTCTVDFDHLRRATVRDSKRDRHLLEIGFDCGPFGLGEVWYVVDGVFVANDYYHPPEFGPEQYEEWWIEPMRDRYGDTVYDYRARAVEVDGEVYVFDVGRVRIDLNLETALKRDNCALVDWSGTPVAFEGATPGQLVWQTGWMVDAGKAGPECAGLGPGGYSTCRKDITYWEASGTDLGLSFRLSSRPTTAVVLDITWDPTEVHVGAAAGGCDLVDQSVTSTTVQATIEPDDWNKMVEYATAGAGDGIADGDQITDVRITVVDELSDPTYHNADDLVMAVTTVDRPDGAICH